MTSILGLDLSLTRAGITMLATHPQDGLTWPALLRDIGHGGRDGASYNDRSDRIVSQARAVLGIAQKSAHWPPAIAVIEGPSYGSLSSHGHGYDRAGLFWGVYSALRNANIPLAVIPPATRAKFVTGNGRADKDVVLDEARKLYPGANILNHDIADSLGLATMGALHLKLPVPFQIRRRHVENVATVTWPVITTAAAR